MLSSELCSMPSLGGQNLLRAITVCGIYQLFNCESLIRSMLKVYHTDLELKPLAIGEPA